MDGADSARYSSRISHVGESSVSDTPGQIEIQIALKADLMRSDLELGLVWFINYSALDPTAVTSKQLDLHGAGMLPVDVEKFAHRWLAFSRCIDINHDGVGRPVHVIESFFNSENVSLDTPLSDPHFVTVFSFLTMPKNGTHKGLPSVSVDLTDTIKKLAKTKSVDDDTITVQLLPVPKQGVSSSEVGTMTVESIEIAVF